MHLLSHITESIRQMGSPDNFSTDVSELLYIEMVKEAYRTTNRVSFEEQRLWYNDRYTGLAYMVQTLEYLALRGSFDWETSRTLKMRSSVERIRSTRYARQVQVAIGDTGPHLRGEMGLAWSEPGYSTSMPISVPEARDKPGMPVSQLLKRTTLAGKVSNRKSLSLGEAATRF